MQWVINAYALVFRVLIVSGGRLADLFGRKRVFMIGTAIFAVFSVLGGIAPNVDVLIACRALMGVGAAMMWPAILGMTYAILPDDKADLAGGLILGVAGFRQRGRTDVRGVPHRCTQLALAVLRERADRAVRDVRDLA